MIELPDGTTITNFGPHEFACRCGCGLGIEEMDLDFLTSLDYARDEAVVPFALTSAYRCKAYNAIKKVGGKPNSSHLRGFAADIEAISSSMKFRIVNGLLSAGITRIGVGKNFIHADSDPKKNPKRIWVY